MTQFKFIASVSTLILASSASAVQKDITVTAEVDTMVNVTRSDASPLPSTLSMEYIPARGLSPIREKIKIWSNSDSNNIDIRLANAPTLNDGNKDIGLSVSIDGKPLTTTASTFTYTSLFPTGISNGSRTLDMMISQTDRSKIPASGYYSGIVSLIVTQSTKGSLQG